VQYFIIFILYNIFFVVWEKSHNIFSVAQIFLFVFFAIDNGLPTLRNGVLWSQKLKIRSKIVIKLFSELSHYPLGFAFTFDFSALRSQFLPEAKPILF